MVNEKLRVSLVLNRENFNLIASGEKKKEYRSLSDRNISLFIDDPESDEPSMKPVTEVMFFEGYSKNRKQILVSVIDTDVEEVEPDVYEIVIHLGDFLTN